MADDPQADLLEAAADRGQGQPHGPADLVLSAAVDVSVKVHRPIGRAQPLEDLAEVPQGLVRLRVGGAADSPHHSREWGS